MKGHVSSCRMETMTLWMTLEGQSAQMGMKGISDQGKKVMETAAIQK